MTKQITDKELENIDGGMDEISDLEQNPPDAPDVGGSKGSGTTGGATGGGGTSGDVQQNTDRDL